MIYQYTTVEEVIGRVLRGIRLTDTGVISDIPVWIGDGMEMLQTSTELEDVEQEVCINFYQARIPCGLLVLNAVYHDGVRLTLDNSSVYSIGRDKKNHRYARQYTYDVVDPFNEYQNHIGIKYESGTKPPTRYFLKPGFICLTSIKDTKIQVHYKRYAVDDNGFPLIPDNGNYKEALYWFVRGKLIGAGILDESRTINEHTCNEKFETLGARAINEITYPSVDKMERIRANHVNFDIPENFWANGNQVYK